MANPNKAKHHFYTVFKNMPYSNEEWEQTNKWRAEFRDRYSEWAARNPGEKLELKFRPAHSFKYGPTCHSHEEARKVCDKALEDGAQMVSYTIYGPKVAARVEERWHRRKGGDWYQK